MRFIWIVFFALSTVAAPQSSQQPELQGRIIGRVVNNEGEPIPEARICSSIRAANSETRRCDSQADVDGNFDIAVPIKTSRIFAEKPEAGYWSDGKPDSGLAVRLSQSEPITHALIKIGATPAKLNITAIDTNTGKTVDMLSFVRWIAIDGTRSFQTSVKGPILIPADMDVVLLVGASGYRTWLYTNLGSPSEVLRLRSGEEKDITAERIPASQ